MKCFKASMMLVATLGLTAAGLSPAMAAPNSGNNGHVHHVQLDGTPFAAKAQGKVSTASVAIPSWSKTNTDALTGTTYNDTYVGTNPSTGTSSTVPVTVVPLNFKLQNKDGTYTTIDATSTAKAAATSPLFTNSSTKPVGENTQYYDGYVRANWNATGGNYHVLLSPTVVQPLTVTISSSNWFTNANGGQTVFNDSAVSPAVRSALANYSASGLTSFVAPNIIGCEDWGTYNQCYGGYHDYVNGHTYALTTVDGSAHNDLQAFSHEVSEWGMDPFVNNSTPNWQGSGGYGCSSILEVGDPVNTSTYTSGTWTLEDEVYNNWFFHTKASETANNAYSMLGVSSYATTC